MDPTPLNFAQFLQMLQSMPPPRGGFFASPPPQGHDPVSRALFGHLFGVAMASAALGPRQNQPLRHPNDAYCPDLFNVPNGKEILTEVMRTGRYDFNKLRQRFPGVPFTNYEEFDNFRSTPTFFRAINAPEGLDDIYGEPYRGKPHLYVLATPKDHEHLEFYSSEELVSTFLYCQDFIDPKDSKKKLTDVQVKRLSLVADRDRILFDTIAQVTMYQSDAFKQAKVLYELCPSELKSCVTSLLELAMYMRGWKGEGPYPLTSLETVGEVDKAKLTERLWALRQHLENDWKDLAGLPLLSYFQGHWSTSGETMTLLQRIMVVMGGEGPQSCIRMNSNLFAWTAWFYLMEFYQTPPFDLQSFREVL